LFKSKNDNGRFESLQKILDGLKIILGVTGSIAVYKACEVLRLLKREGADIQVVMTESAKQFVCPLTFKVLSTHKVVDALFQNEQYFTTEHISLAEWADIVLVCPATANVIGKVASGVADDFLTTMIMASRSPVLFAPAMDLYMAKNPIYLSNVEKLKKLGYCFIDPEEGQLASGLQGPGRLASMKRIIEGVQLNQRNTRSLDGKKILVTAGPTRESIDPVRYISNPSTGTMGYAIAEEAILRGAEVTLISGPTELETFSGMRLIRITTSEEMKKAVLDEWSQQHILIMAAAVSDYRPVKTSNEKIKKHTDTWQLELEKTEDILASLASKKKKGLLIGFALETENGLANAKRKLKEKQLDLICLNTLENGAGFGKETNQVTLIDQKGNQDQLPLLTKREVAKKILDRIEKLLEK
jgi:phosphopantothenoylcysteine decarboxylase/phosphopantothenate--cysteine ligase